MTVSLLQAPSGERRELVPSCHDTDPEAAAELRALFASTRLEDHMLAREICLECPVLASCERLTEDTMRELGWADAPEGTWAGVLFRAGRPRKMRRALARKGGVLRVRSDRSA